MDRKLEEQIKEAKKVIKEGGIVFFPTETAYGIAADATSSEAVESLRGKESASEQRSYSDSGFTGDSGKICGSRGG